MTAQAMMNSAQDRLQVDDLTFEVRRSDRRRTMQITVDRGGELVFAAPDDCPPSTMEAFVREKRFWIYTKLAEKEAHSKTSEAREYKSGEGFAYLGRSYRLLLVGRQDPPVKLSGGRFRMRRDCAAEGHQHMVAWYREHSTPWLKKRLPQWVKRVGVEPAGISVKDLGFRWGSCSKDGTVNFHWRVAMLPPRVVEYLVVHELTHLHEAHHTPEFWRRVERAMPDFAARKQWLAEHGAAASRI